MPLLTSDRLNFAPPHQGPKILPNTYYFSRLVRLAHKPHLIAIEDITYGYKATYLQLFTDVLHFRNVLRHSLDASTVAKIDRDEEVFLNILGPGGYEFTVAFLALKALGAVIVPISVDLPVKEAVYFARKCRAVGVVTAAKCVSLGEELQREMMASSDSNFHCIQITEHLMRPPLQVEELIISSDAYVDLSKSGLVIFTSSITGLPKGAVKRRGSFVDVATLFADAYDMREGDLVLHIVPVHHATDITLTLLLFLWAGACIELRLGGFDAEWTWERIKQGDLDFFSGVPTIYMRLMQFYEYKLAKLPDARRQAYEKGAGRIRSMLCGTSTLPRPLSEKWKRLRGGKEDGPRNLSIEKLRKDLRTSLAGYKMPTMLRVVMEIRKNPTGKVEKKILQAEYFPNSGHPNV